MLFLHLITDFFDFPLLNVHHVYLPLLLGLLALLNQISLIITRRFTFFLGVVTALIVQHLQLFIQHLPLFLHVLQSSAHVSVFEVRAGIRAGILAASVLPIVNSFEVVEIDVIYVGVLWLHLRVFFFSVIL